MQTAPLFLELNRCIKPIIVCQGGGDAGKTVAILQDLTMKLIARPNSLATVTAQDVPNLRGGALRLFEKYILTDEEVARCIVSKNITDRIYRFYNGSIIEFKCFDDEADARGSERDFLFINEATAFTFSLFWQLRRKTRVQTYVDYNPTSSFWVHEQLLKDNPEFDGKVQLYIVDHRHNPFLTEEEHDAYEKINDADLFKVYARGLTGRIKGLIFGNFKQVDAMPDDCTKYIWGIDYGYTNDPSAITRIGIKPRKRYWKECAYETGISAENMKEQLIKNGYTPGEIIYSEHDVHMISQLRRLGLPVYPARKGPGSIIAGISKVKEFENFYTADSTNLVTEINTWKWTVAQDLTTGKEILTNIPVDGYDHLCQSGIYAIYTDSFRQIA